LTIRNPVDQFGEAAIKFSIKDLFYAFSAHAFIMHQLIKPVFQ
jgi:hypothetical protein